MKLMIAAALAVFAVPAMAQDTPPPASTPAPTPGGYEPAPTPPPPPGAVVEFQPSVPPSQAFPPPPPLEKYPVCKKGQYDKCVERGGRK